VLRRKIKGMLCCNRNLSNSSSSSRRKSKRRRRGTRCRSRIRSKRNSSIVAAEAVI
jgi:hypothetical protein